MQLISRNTYAVYQLLSHKELDLKIFWYIYQDDFKLSHLWFLTILSGILAGRRVV